MFRRLSLLLFISLLPAFAAAYTSNDYYQAGLSLYQQKNYPGAIAYLKAAVQLDPANWQANQVLGYAYYQTNDSQNALNAFNQSLQTHPDNPSLRSFTDRLRSKTLLGAPVTQATAPPPGSEVSSPVAPAATPLPETSIVFRKGKKWSNFHAGGALATLGDLPMGANTIAKNYPASIYSATVNPLGIIVGADSGFCLDDQNAVGLEANIGFFDGYKDVFKSGPFTGSDSFSLTMGSFEVKYYLLLPMGDSRLRLGAGPGLYITDLQALEISNGTVVLSGPMAGYGFGGSLNVGLEIYLSPDFMLSVFAEGRYASTSNIQGQFQDSSGNLHQIGLAADSYGYIGAAYTTNIGNNGIRWANIDYTGGGAGLGLSFRY